MSRCGLPRSDTGQMTSSSSLGAVRPSPTCASPAGGGPTVTGSCGAGTAVFGGATAAEGSSAGGEGRARWACSSGGAASTPARTGRWPCRRPPPRPLAPPPPP
jgi:hypothetical protein